MSKNLQLSKALKGLRPEFLLCDFHVHSPASADVRQGKRFTELLAAERTCLSTIGEETCTNARDYELAVIRAYPPSEFLGRLVEQRNQLAQRSGLPEGNDWAVIAVTDHNVCNYASLLATLAWQERDVNRLIVLPGIELEVAFPTENQGGEVAAHILCLFQPGLKESDIRISVHDAAGGNSWDFGQTLRVGAISKFVTTVRNHDRYPAICIAAHIGSSKGVRQEVNHFILTRRQAEIARLEAELEIGQIPVDAAIRGMLEAAKRAASAQNVSLEVLRLIGSCGFDGLQVSDKQDDIHYRRLHRYQSKYGRAVPIVASDAHTVSRVFHCCGYETYVKIGGGVGSMTEGDLFKSMGTALRYGETRFCYATPNAPTMWIAGIEITQDADGASEFWPFEAAAQIDPPADGPGPAKSFFLPLSRNLNCLVGGRGSGKSAALDAIAFVAKPEDFDGYKKISQDTPDFYSRSNATLKGCQVKLCWQFQSASISALRKGQMFSSRYFSPDHRHPALRHTNIEDAELVPSQVPAASVELFRLREIEEAAKPGELRGLLDRICGDEIAELERKITEAVVVLTKSRGRLINIAKQINGLSDEGAVLREFVFRKQEYELANRPDVQAYYTNSDHASYADSVAEEAVGDWRGIQALTRTDELKTAIVDFYKGLYDASVNEHVDVRPYCGPIFQLLSSQEHQLPWCTAGTLLGRLNEHLIGIATRVSTAAEETSAAHKEARDQLAQKGLPAGGQDREAKKRAFEEAQAGLSAYRNLTEEWKHVLTQRKDEFVELEALCRKRTELRKATTERITSQLAEDLDRSVLVIEADAQPAADKSVFQEWLMETIGPSLPRYKAERVDALIGQGLLPATLREVLLGEGDEGILQVNKPRANQGKIDQSEALAVLGNCRARSISEPEKKEQECLPELWETLPHEIREGLWGFPDGASRLDKTLRLDEIIFNDVPIVRLNDRPGDPDSKPRPLSELSQGQRCSALLPIILLNGTIPLIIDQPEDNLDNRLIRQIIVNILASIKLKRQVIVATHNPNLPVLGDAERAIILQAVGENKCCLEAAGTVDAPDVCTYIQNIMEGGREAFQYRHSIYEQHWTDTVVSM